MTIRSNDLAVAEFIMEITKCDDAPKDLFLQANQQILSCKADEGNGYL
jgi:hypothetical protein